MSLLACFRTFGKGNSTPGVIELLENRQSESRLLLGAHFRLVGPSNLFPGQTLDSFLYPEATGLTSDVRPASHRIELNHTNRNTTDYGGYSDWRRKSDHTQSRRGSRIPEPGLCERGPCRPRTRVSDFRSEGFSSLSAALAWPGFTVVRDGRRNDASIFRQA